ncbi:hypothetical protein GCK32_021064, partial [Trichostrongylus colubriformis]
PLPSSNRHRRQPVRHVFDVCRQTAFA